MPLCIDSSNSLAVEAALKVHQGTALLNSISGEKEDKKMMGLAFTAEALLNLDHYCGGCLKAYRKGFLK